MNLEKTSPQSILVHIERFSLNKDFQLAFIITTHNSKVAQIGTKKFLLEKGELSIIR